MIHHVGVHVSGCGDEPKGMDLECGDGPKEEREKWSVEAGFLKNRRILILVVTPLDQSYISLPNC
ncbi:hypothetical protein HanRHA438_Chr11g0490881 [Helianthus annuus]|nr:hypothetical protein HanHA300_Chr11g0391501 [Helianthus annuus]KAJ0508208.1 hypothetical protein HanIR_Chr11g0514701 [Helianthus annuus]KAJ0516506.1 hypothetical protein HanHA89_Chr11g0414591 [Helianthus annuus]KAJ0688447.1 hypothetical protein HanOQP8_Chr11g0394401 [Helianthus annuus]KAJ0869599.1 hypothetical protein HanRHA438_Chr11g0490881 [Helianthus annuus]